MRHALFRPLLLIALAGLGATAARSQPAPPRAAAVWPQAHSDLPPDPAVRFGVLANGMRYALMHNATPADAVSLRLRVGSGSLEESDAQQGLAHVLEHMAFKGSTHVPTGEMVKILQRKGLAFGPDTNAETGWTQTVYMLDLPRNDADSLDTGLMLMRETAGELTLDDKALASERGVVLSEERLRDTPEYRAQRAQLQLLLDDQLAARRFPIGEVEVIRNAPAGLVRKFYEANYRPERATLIAVGDFDVEAMEARIKARFSDWRAVGAPTVEPDLGRVAPRGLTVKVVHLPGASTQAIIAWARPFDASPDTAAKEHGEVIENLGLAVLNRRLGRLARAANPPFLAAAAGFENLFHSEKIAVIQAGAAPDAWRPAVDAAAQEVRRLTANGVTRAELDREITEMRVVLQNAAAGASTRPTTALASGLVDAVDQDGVFTTPATDLALFEATVETLPPATVDSALRAVFAGAGPLVELATPQPEGGDAALKAELARAFSSPLAARGDAATLPWPYARLGSPGRIADRKTVPDLGVTTVRFANGVGLTVKPTAFRKDQVLVQVRVGGGRLDLPPNRPGAGWEAGALIGGGYGKLSYEDAQTVLAGTTHEVGFSIADTAFEFTGGARSQDLVTELQVIGAYLADPGFRPEAFERLRTALLAELPQMAATPNGVMAREAGALFTRGDPRFAFPNREDLLAATPSDLRALLAGPLAKGRVEVTIVGDITVDQAVALTADTLGALPTRPMGADEVSAAQVRFPGPTPHPVMLSDTGRTDQAVAVVAWPITDFFADMSRSRAVMLAGEVLGNRLLDELRIAQGATYSPETLVNLSQSFPGYGYAFNLVEIPPGKIDGFFASVSAITADLRARPPTADELARARNPRIATLHKAQLTNEYWLIDLGGSLADPRRLDLIRTTFADYEKVTPADIQAVARRWFTDEAAWKLVIKAAGK